MPNKYVIKFTKNGFAKYTSHLDLLRMFKRAFKKSGIKLKYSHGFNPHPKMAFAQPLSLGYSSRCELLEFETETGHASDELLLSLRSAMPDGIEITSVSTFEGEKTLASYSDSCEYKIWFPLALPDEELQKLLSGYMGQESITAIKRIKKTKTMDSVEIKHMIRSLRITSAGEFTLMTALLDCGSHSNLSPELVISSFTDYVKANLPESFKDGTENIEEFLPRHEIEVERVSLGFSNGFEI